MTKQKKPDIIITGSQKQEKRKRGGSCKTNLQNKDRQRKDIERPLKSIELLQNHISILS